ncbi:hypothetical protein Q8V72_003652 [Escherichia coli]|nr:hypothetical protein [Escherichia coli]EKR2566546.1 hypothetical protein [Escherichia coli]ELH8647054.1 hypothetical protein [Escherichia coli]MDF0838563.1 hypothetical protein [Escherichia coli]
MLVVTVQQGLIYGYKGYFYLEQFPETAIVYIIMREDEAENASVDGQKIRCMVESEIIKGGKKS